MTATTDVTVHRDLAYATVDGRPLALDLYLPPQDGRRGGPPPVVLYLHGGGFAVGDKADRARERLVPVARAGVAVASARYRFSDVATYPAQVHDVKAAVRWLRAHAAEYGYGAQRVGVWGASAGGYLALMLGLTGGSAEHEGDVGADGDQDSSVQAVCAWFPVTDIVAAETVPLPDGRVLPPFIAGPLPEPSFLARLLGVERITDDPERAAAASPVTYARRGTPPGSFLLMHGDADGMVGEDQSQRLHAALTGSGADATLLLIADANHEGPEFDGPAVLGAVAGFFGDRLGG